MKILIVTNSLATGGAEKLILDTVPEFVKKGVEVTLVLLNGNSTPFLDALRKKNVCEIVSLSNGSVYNPLLIFKLIPHLKNHTIVHVHLFPSLYWVAIAKLLSRSKATLFFTEHSTSNKRIRNGVFKILERFIYNKYDKVVCITHKVRTIFMEHLNFPKEQMPVINNGVPIDKFKNAKKIERTAIDKMVKETDYLLVQVSGFREQKDQPTLIKALSNLPEDIKLVLVGEGDYRSGCEQLVDKLQLNHRVFFLGLRMDVAEILKTCDVCVLSSYYEGLSLSSIEGMASGNPFVASRVPGLEEMVDGAGLLFEQGDSVALASHIELLRNDKDFAKQIAEKCEQRASRYSIEMMVDNHIKLYEQYA
ncbi:glycosyltransferase [Marinirhabdus gelatinilytica]|uniref:Glycosyltransferase involved in cell wall biosynthesis n=1 Tax=Marinirhabdus gelatinilytica TaxID=1703343 RepID=A0A370QG48_9FLAO|nr:glycosyltransferase [Marinirhabdus gelatinilytica]RDK87332.1 glycosyltransferase involved in cell wall biosynthesis [Marinirhabdus gelatinilytica]